MKRPARYTGFVATMVAALALAACGGDATVENDDVSSVAPLTQTDDPAEESAGETDTDGEETTTEDSDQTSEPNAPAPPPAQPQPEDGAAEEIEEIPEQAPQRSDEEEALLGELGDGGINVDGVEDQLIGAANTVCDSQGSGEDTNVIVPAVAGQLIEQGKTELSNEEATELIDSAARSAYC